MRKFHVALSFAGEDRDYVEKVARELVAEGVRVFYDKFEEDDLWGKDLYEHLSDVYQNKALYTIMFISDSYRQKLWTNHERKAAQARAFAESKEYILPAFFDESVSVPEVLKTTGYVSLLKRQPEQFAALVIKKLRKAGVMLSGGFSYSEKAKADIDWPLKKSSAVTKIIADLKSYNWYQQNPAIEKLLDFDWEKVDADEAFVLGRNLYQCACGGERRAGGILGNLRRELARIPDEYVVHLLNGMFFEVYFNSSGEFRSERLKTQMLEKLLAIQGVKRFAQSIRYIRNVLEPYKEKLPMRPNFTPEVVNLILQIRRTDPPLVKSISCNGCELLCKADDDSHEWNRVWKISFKSFTVEELREMLGEAWGIPLGQLQIETKSSVDPKLKLRLPDGMMVRW